MRLNRILITPIIIMCSVLVLIVSTVYAQTPTPNPATLIDDCTRTLKPDRPIPTGADSPSIKIIAPASGTVVTTDQAGLADVTFRVEVQNWKLPGIYTEEDVPHWHLWLNDSVWGMFYQTEVLSGIPVGTWRMCASLGDPTHLDIGMPDAILLTVKRRDSQTAVITITPATQPSPSPTEPPIMSASETSPPLIPILVIAFIAAFGGIALGWRRSRT